MFKKDFKLNVYVTSGSTLSFSRYTETVLHMHLFIRTYPVGRGDKGWVAWGWGKVSVGGVGGGMREGICDWYAKMNKKLKK